MKSLMEEASTIFKAIEKGWINAGKPKEFSVKVYEEPEKNFIGMTTKPAKIGIFFEETQKAEQRSRYTKQADTQRPTPRPAPERERPAREPREVQKVEKKEPLPPKVIQESREPREPKEDLGPIWNDEMVASTKEWVAEILSLMGQGSVPFTINPKRFHLRIEFSGSVLENKDKQKHLFALLSGLIMTMLKRQHKRPLRGYKIVLTELVV